MRRHLGVACAVLALSPISAAASPWSAPVQVSADIGSRPDLAVNGRGDAVAAWNGAGVKGVWVSDRPAGALFSPARRVADGSAPHVAINEDGLTAVAWSAGAAGVRALVGRSGATEVVGESDHPGDTGWAPLDVAINRRGDVVVAWAEPDGRLDVASRPAGGSFGPPQALGVYDRGLRVRVTLGEAGHSVVAWQGSDGPWRPPPDTPPNRVWIAEGDVGGAYGSPTVLSGAGPDDNVDGGFSAAGNARGDVVVTWSVGVIGSGSSSSLTRGIYATSKAPGGSFEAARLIVPEASSPWPPLNLPTVAVDPGGVATVAAVSPCHVAAITRRPGGAWGPLRELWRDCERRAGDPAAAFDSLGRTVVATGGARGDGGPSPLLAGRVSSGAVDGPDRVSRPGTHNFLPALGFDAVGNGLVMWEGDDGADADQHGIDTTRPIQLAVYDGRRPAISDFGIAAAEPAFKFRLSEPARVTVSVARLKHGHARGLGSVRARALRGRHLLPWNGKLLRELRKAGRYRATISGRDSANKQARPRRLTFGP